MATEGPFILSNDHRETLPRLIQYYVQVTKLEVTAAMRSVAVRGCLGHNLVADGRLPASLLWAELASGDRSVLGDITGPGPILVNVPSVIMDQANDWAFVVDSEIQGPVVVELSSGQRAITSQ